MADRTSSRDRNLDEILKSLSSKFSFCCELKHEQRVAINNLLDGNDVLAVLPTGYGKSFIFQIFVLACERERRMSASVIVICPLKSLVDDQIEEAKAIGISACALSDLSVEDLICRLRSAKFQLMFGSAEVVLDTDRLNVIKDRTFPLHNNLVAVVVDECHTVETWTGKR